MSTTWFSISQPSPADVLATETEQLAFELLKRPAAHFVAGDLLWLHDFTRKMRWGTTLEQEQQYRETVEKVKARCDELAPPRREGE